MNRVYNFAAGPSTMPEEALETMQWWSENPGKVFRILVEF